ncbi:MAG TPA: MFS transporter [Ktedonobacterales bacterium]
MARMLIKLNGLWREPDFLKLWTGQTISKFGSYISGVALPLTALLVLAATPVQMGILVALEGAPVLLVGLFAGVWVDRLRRRPILIACDLGRALLLGSIPLAAALGVLRMEQLYLVAALAGIFTVFFDIANQSYLPALVERERLVEANSKLGSSDSLAEISGPALGGGLVQVLTAPFAIVIDALSFLGSALCVGAIRKPEAPSAPLEERQNVWREIVEGMGLVTRQPVLRALMGGMCTFEFFGGFFGTLYTLYAVRDLHMPPALVGALVGLGGVGALLGSFVVGWVVRRLGVGRALIGAMLFAATLQLLIPLARGPLALAVLMMAIPQVVGDIGWAVFLIGEVSLRQSVIPDRLLGRANASMQFFTRGVSPLGALLGGALGALIGARFTLLIAVCGILLGSLWLIFSPIRGLREHPAPAEEEKVIA